jgi:hypothetical protein
LEPDGTLRLGNARWDLDQYGMPRQPVELLALCRGRAYGRFVLDAVPGTVAPIEARQVAAILANQVGTLLANQARVGR